jgi:hypothetical protein
MDDGRIQLQVQVGLEGDADPAEFDEATSLLRQELLDLNVDEVKRPSAGSPPPGTRGAETVALGTLLVTASREIVAAAVRVVASWLARRPSRTVKLAIDGDSIELTDVRAEDQRRLLEAFLARHAAPPA